MGIASIVGLGLIVGVAMLMSLEGQDILNEGPRLADLQIQHATFGTPIARVFGSYRLGGNIIWALPLKETQHEVESDTGGKGGGDSYIDRTFTYTGTWASAICEGPILGFKKIWFDSVLVYDDKDYYGGLTESKHYGYLGTDTQEINWIIQASDPNTPAYRHICYIVFDDIDLSLYGNRIPNVSVEIVQNGSISMQETENVVKTTGLVLSNPVPIQDVIYGYTYNQSTDILTLHNNVNGLDTIINNKTIDYTTQKDVYNHDSRFCAINDIDIYEILYVYDFIDEKTSYSSLGDFYHNPLLYIFNGGKKGTLGESSYIQVRDNIALAYYSTTNTVIKMFEQNYMGDSYDPGILVGDYGLSDLLIADSIYRDMCLGINEFYMFYTTENKIAVFNLEGIFLRDIVSHVSLPYTPGNVLTSTYMRSDDIGDLYIYVWNEDKKPTIYKATSDSIILFSETTDPIGISDPSIQKSFGAYMGDIYTSDITLNRYSVVTQSIDIELSTIILDILKSTPLQPSDYKINTNDETIYGFVIPSPSTARSMLSVLLDVFLYDIIEYDYLLNINSFTAKPTILEIPENEVIKDFIINRKNTTELNTTINVMYSNKDRLYESATQKASRIDESSIKIENKQYPIAISDSLAKQLAEILLFTEWSVLETFEFILPSSYNTLEPSQVIDIINKGITYNVRIRKITYNTDFSINIEADLNNSNVYVSDAIAADTSTLFPTTVKYISPSYTLVLDLPLFTNSINDINTQVVSTGFSNNWPGSAVYKESSNNILKKLGTIFNYSIIGTAISVLGIYNATILDTYNTVTVSVIYGSLYSISYTKLLNAGNYILLGDEVLQYQTALDNGDGTYTLSNLLRGRRGTEWAINTHNIGDKFVFLSNNMLIDPNVILNVEETYTSKTLGSAYGSNTISVLPQAVSMMPLTVSYIKGTRDVDGNLTIQWTRRSRELNGYFRTLSLFEIYESYSIDIVSGIGRTITSNTNSIIYTAADQIADGLALNTDITVDIYQISDVVQRGYRSRGVV